MPRLTQSLPRIRKHKASGQAVVYLGGRTIYLGPYGSRIAKEQYDRVVAEWLQQGRTVQPSSGSLTIGELSVAYLRFAKKYYVKSGRRTSEVGRIKSVTRLLNKLYMHSAASEFGPLALQTFRDHLVADSDWSRTTINGALSRVKRMFRWAAQNEMVDGSVCVNLDQVTGLRKGKTAARDSRGVAAVCESVVDATLPHLPSIVADMVRLQLLTGCRPSEVCCIRPCDVDRTGEVWLFTPPSHKTEHHDRQRQISIGPKAQQVLLPYLLRPAVAYCFNPQESESKRRAEVQRRTPTNQGDRPGNSARTRSGRKSKRKPRERYARDSYEKEGEPTATRIQQD